MNYYPNLPPPTTPPPAPPTPRHVVIRVKDERAIVSDGETPAQNWKALEESAKDATAEQGCSGENGVFNCPDDLARKAIWAAR